MKKIIAAVLAALMVLAMAACGSQEQELPKSDLTPLPTGTTGTTESTESTEPSADPAQDTEKKKDTVSLGQMQGGVYTNTYAGFSCTLDENWTFMTAEQLQELPGAAAALFEGSALDVEDISATMIADLMAENLNTLCSINIQYQKLEPIQRMILASATPDQVADELLKQKDVLIDAYEHAGMANVVLEKKTVTFLGEKRVAVRTTADVSGVSCYILQIQDYSRGAYGVTLTLTSYLEDNTESLLFLFTKA